MAEKKKRVEYSLHPRGTAWSRDDSKFGQKILEKMGWQKGKGLGADETGMTEHVKVKIKTDMKGIGYSNKDEDNWIAHQESYNCLLSSLNQSHGIGSTAISGDNLISLEQKSKSFRRRVHYRKFTKGKDLSLKKKKDLDCIFGKRTKLETDIQTPEAQSADNSPKETQEYGVKTVQSSQNAQDYFAKKLADRKRDKDLKVKCSVDVFTELPALSRELIFAEDITNSGLCSEKSEWKQEECLVEAKELVDVKKKNKHKMAGFQPQVQRLCGDNVNCLVGTSRNYCDDENRAKSGRFRKKKKKDFCDEILQDCASGVASKEDKKRKKEFADEKIAKENGDDTPQNHKGYVDKQHEQKKLKREKELSRKKKQSINCEDVLKYDTTEAEKVENNCSKEGWNQNFIDIKLRRGDLMCGKILEINRQNIELSEAFVGSNVAEIAGYGSNLSAYCKEKQ